MFPVNSNSIAKLRIVNDTQYHKRCTSVYLVLAVPAMIFQALSHVLGNWRNPEKRSVDLYNSVQVTAASD